MNEALHTKLLDVLERVHPVYSGPTIRELATRFSISTSGLRAALREMSILYGVTLEVTDANGRKRHTPTPGTPVDPESVADDSRLGHPSVYCWPAHEADRNDGE